VEETRNPAVALLEFERRVQTASSNREVAFRAVNDSSQVLRFDQAILWRRDIFSRPMVVVASGLADVSVDSPFQQWIVGLIQAITPEPFIEVRAVPQGELPEAVLDDSQDWCPEHLLHCPLVGPDGTPLGGILFFRAEPFTDAERAMAEWIARSSAYGLWAWRTEHRGVGRWLKSSATRKTIGYTAIIALLLLFIPVTLTVLAPAEITPLRPIPITSPMDGVVREVVVKPNQIVKAGELIAVLDDTSLRNRLEVAAKALEISRADLQRATFKSFSDEASRLDLQVLNARVQEKLTEVTYVTELLAKTKLTAPQGGVPIFSSQDDWRGRPVQLGERIIVVADPSLIDVTIYLPPDDAVELERGAPVDVWLHVDPLSPLKASIERASYDAVPTPEGTLAYTVHATLEKADPLPRIGLRGTSKIHAGRVSLAYYLMRKPLAYMRRSFGF
jgi:hypothetical protein